MMIRSTAILGVCTVTTLVAAALAQTAPKPVAQLSASAAFFESKIRPLLVEKCYSCHSEKSRPIMGALKVDTRAALLAGGSHGPAIVPGDPEKSTLIRAVRYTDEKMKMPPQGRLTDAQIADLETWVKSGATDPRGAAAGPAKRAALTLEQGRRFWSFMPLGKSQPPKTADSWARTGADRFILTQLTAKGIRPNGIADKQTLIRRAYFDLIGLPPTRAEVEAFTDDTRPDAWQRVINHLLESPHYGERWGRHWLDLARFAESHGYEQDYDRPNAYNYRDFVIQALNKDLPFDTFVKWQLAGDELEPENPLALMATGFLGAGTHATQITKNQVEKERYDELDDMLNTTGTTFLGLTLGCARCHDHKYDPVSARDYYRMAATFTTTVRSDFEVNMDPIGFRESHARWSKEHAPLAAALAEYERNALPGAFEAWVKQGADAGPPIAWKLPKSTAVISAGGATMVPVGDGSFLATGKNPDADTYTITLKTGMKNIRALRIEALAHSTMTKGGPGRADNGNFALSDCKVTSQSDTKDAKPSQILLVHPKADFEQSGLPASASIDNDPKSGWAVDPQFGKDHAVVYEFAKPVMGTGDSIITVTLKFETNTRHSIGRIRVSLSTDDRDFPIISSSRPELLDRALDDLRAGKTLEASAKDEALKWFRSRDSGWMDKNARVISLAATEPQPPMRKVMICSEGVTAIRTHTQGGDYLDQTHILKRGDPNQKIEVANQGFLTVLERDGRTENAWLKPPPAGSKTSFRRTSMANWITDVYHGGGALLARVIVNRLWQHHLGRGIVSTPSDFGAVGDPPTHPELLDWLASELIREGWSLKAMHRLIMNSAVYMQTSATDAKRSRLDPENKLFWRKSRQRLEAEVIRDSILHSAGMLDTTMYGPGTLDENMKRRSIYFFVKRSRLIPTMMIFDAPNALQSIAMRPTTTVAPQALLLMNNHVVREAAEKLASTASKIAGEDINAAITEAYWRTLSRKPTKVELEQANGFLTQQAISYHATRTENPEMTALADFCQVLFSLNEFIYAD